MNIRCLSVHGCLVTPHSHSMYFGDDLMPEADAQNGHVAAGSSHKFLTDACLCRSTGAGRQHNVCWIHRQERLNGHLIIANNPNLDRRIDHTDAVHEIPRERIVIVDEQQHRGKVASQAALRRGPCAGDAVLSHHEEVFGDRIGQPLVITVDPALYPLQKVVRAL